MKVEAGLLWSTLLCAARASTDAAVYLFPSSRQATPKPPSLTPAEARLIFAHRLGVSQYHELNTASYESLQYISEFSGTSRWLLDGLDEPLPAELVLLIEGLSSEDAKLALNTHGDASLAFTIAKPPSTKANQKLVDDLTRQAGMTEFNCQLDQAINPFEERCWNGGKSKIVHVNMGKDVKHAPTLTELQRILSRILAFSTKQELRALIAFLPTAKSSKSTYGTYDMPTQSLLTPRGITESPLSLNDFSTHPSASDPIAIRVSNSSDAPVRGVVPSCFATFDACVSGTNNCSSHGECGKKFKSAGSATCFTCFCGNSTDFDDEGNAIGITNWGGGACQKRDISAPFWLIAVSTVVLIGLVSWAIGMLFTVGEEKLPGVIGAGVSSKSR